MRHVLWFAHNHTHEWRVGWRPNEAETKLPCVVVTKREHRAVVVKGEVVVCTASYLRNGWLLLMLFRERELDGLEVMVAVMPPCLEH